MIGKPRFRVESLILLLLSGSISRAEELQFHSQATKPRDGYRQVVQFALDAEHTYRQNEQLVDSTRRLLRRWQDRSVTVLAVNKGVPQRAQVTFHRAVEEVQSAGEDPVVKGQPVDGKTYLVERRGNELHILDAEGREPADDELRLVRESLQTFGQPNPLAAFLDGKSVRVGESLDLPISAARELLGWTGNQGKTEKLKLQMTRIESVAGAPCGVFETLLQASKHDASTMTLLMKGELTIEAATCRSRAMTLSGPVAISEMRGPLAGRFTVSTSGTLNVAVRSRYTPSPRR